MNEPRWLDGQSEDDLNDLITKVSAAVHPDKMPSPFYVQSMVIAISGQPVAKLRWDGSDLVDYEEIPLTSADLM